MTRLIRHLAAALLRALMPTGDAREALPGDLEELYRERVRTRGGMHAFVWYVREVAWTVVRYLPARVVAVGRRRRHGVIPEGGGGIVEGLVRDVTLASRRITSSPGFALAVAGTLGLGVGANTAVFSVVRGVLLRPLPYPQEQRIVSVYETSPDIEMSAGWTSIPNYLDWRDRTSSFEALALFRGRSASIDTEDLPRYVYGARVTPEFYAVFGVDPLLGRALTPEDAAPDGPAVALISHALWRGGFGESPDIVGRTVRIDGEPTTILGVMPPGFTAPAGFIGPGVSVDVWRPFPLDPSAGRGDRSFNVVGRLAAGRTVGEARVELETLQTALQRRYPDADAGWSVQVRTWHDLTVGVVRPGLVILMGLMALVLVVACANVANLMVGRALVRDAELATKVALGARPIRLVREFVVEALTLSVLGAMLGLVLARGGLELLRRFEPGVLPRLGSVAMDGTVLVFGLAVAGCSAIAFGGAAAATVVRRDPGRSLAGARAGPGRAGSRIRAGLAVGQLATAFALLVGAGLLVRSLRSLTSTDLGFDEDDVTAATVALSWNRVPDPGRRMRFVDDVLEELRAIPGVESAGMINSLPLSGSMQQLSVGLGSAASAYARDVVVSVRAVSPGYLASMGIPLLEGRDFTSSDVTEPNTVLVNRSLARRFGPTVRDALGASVTFGGDEPVTVVGVVGDVRHHGPGRDVRLEVYRPHSLDPLTSKSFVVRSSVPATELSRAVAVAVQRVDPEQPVREVRSMSKWAHLATAPSRFLAGIAAIAAALAATLAGVGLFAALSALVGQRRRELALRMALGANGAQVLREVLRTVGGLVAAGLATGIVLAMLLGGALHGFLYGVGSRDPVVLITVAVGLAAIGGASAVTPVRRALTLEPARTLRDG